jgi:type IV pilus assembly protein PilY1
MLGHIYNRVHTVQLNDGKTWFIAPNGINADGQVTGIFLVDTHSSLSQKQVVRQFTSETTGGLTTITPYDLNDDGKIDMVYGGDLQGNIWKFDLTGNNASAWAAAKPQRLFQAKGSDGKAQPINQIPLVAKFKPVKQTTTSFNSPNVMVYVGTGKLIETCDNSSTPCEDDSSQNTMYGLWDAGTPICSLEEMQEQVLGEKTVDGVVYRTVTNNQPTWATEAERNAAKLVDCSDAARAELKGHHLGWYEHLPLASERITGNLSINGDGIIYQSYVPNGLSGDPCIKDDVTFTVQVNVSTGGHFSTNSVGGLPDGNEEIIGGSSSGSTGGVTIKDGDNIYVVNNNTDGTTSLTPPFICVGQGCSKKTCEESSVIVCGPNKTLVRLSLREIHGVF